MYLLPRWDVKGNAPVWLVWIELVRSSMQKKASWVLVIGVWWKDEPSPSIFIFTSSFLMILSNALCLVDRMPWC
jgi:hypothetical protein